MASGSGFKRSRSKDRTSMEDIREDMGKGPSNQKKRTTASQFFNKDELPAQSAESAASSTHDTVVELLNNAAIMPKGVDKITDLRKVQELIVYKSPDLLDSFLDEMLAFQTDSSKDVKKFVVGFIEEACKKDKECLPKVLPSMLMLLTDEDVNVQKKVILTSTSMFKITLEWIIKAKKVRSEMAEVWSSLKDLNLLLYDLLESHNDGIRTHVVKFLEGISLLCSKRIAESDIPKKSENDPSLDQIPPKNGIVSPASLEDDGKKAFATLLQFQSSQHISSINLMTVTNALSNIAKQRPQFFDQVVQSYEALHVNLPPTLAKSQVSSVRKNLKIQMMGLLKHPSSIDFLQQISTLLTDLGASSSEIAKNMPKDIENRKRKAAHERESSYSSKKTKIEIDDDDDGMTPWIDRSKKKSKPEPAQKQTAIDVTAEDILPRLSSQNVADLVLLSMVMLPEKMPAQFESTYTPIAAAGTETQIGHIARLLATQLTMAGMGKGLGELQLATMKEQSTKIKDDDTQDTSPKQTIQTLVGLKTGEEELVVKRPKISQLPLPPPSRKPKNFSLSNVTTTLDSSTLEMMTTETVERVIDAEKSASLGHVENHRIKLLASLTTMFGESQKDALQSHIFSDIRGRQDLAFAWLYQEYANSMGYSASHSLGMSLSTGRYDECLTRLLVGFMNHEDHYADVLFHKILIEAPTLTDNGIIVIKRYCADPSRAEKGMKSLRQLMYSRPNKSFYFLRLLLEFSDDENAEVRKFAIQAIQELHIDGRNKKEIEFYATQELKKLLKNKPIVLGELDKSDTWTEETIKAHLYLYLGLLPSNHKLIHELATVYTATSPDIKRTILRVLETPVRGMGMDSPELLTLVETCPKGSETLVMRVIHILTDKAVPSPQLVERIRDLYHKRVPDVRFLIPVLNGLSKSEVMEALPKLIKLNPMVVKEVFNRLMGSHVSSESIYRSPLTPVDLLVALHNIDPSKCDMKTIIKAANLCFNERTTYTQEVLAIVMQQLMEQDPLPTLLMRTVIQSLTMYPRLMGFVLNILQRLIVKKVWKQKKVWEGFIRCCQRAKPQSFEVLLMLPATQLKDVFEVCPDLRQPLITHVEEFTENQKSHVNKSVMELLKETNAALSEVKEADKNIPTNNSSDRNVEQKGIKINTISEEPVRISTVTSVKSIDSASGLETSNSKVEKSEGSKTLRQFKSFIKDRKRELEDTFVRKDVEENTEKKRDTEGSSDKSRGEISISIELDYKKTSKAWSYLSSRKEEDSVEDGKSKSRSKSSSSSRQSSSATRKK